MVEHILAQKKEQFTRLLFFCADIPQLYLQTTQTLL